MMRKRTLEHLVQHFAENVAAQTEAIMAGNARKGNLHAKKYLAAFDALTSRGDLGREALSLLLKHEQADVRSMAACFLLRYKTGEAMAVLREVVQGRGLIAFEASECLKRWEEGTWQLDPANE